MPLRTVQIDLITWNRRLSRHAKAGQYKETLNLFQQMQLAGMHPNKFTFVPVLNACSSLRALEEGRRIHSQIIQNGHESDLYIGSCLVDMYANCRSIEDAVIVFNKMAIRDVVIWNAMILGHVKCGQAQKALELWRRMREVGVAPERVTFVGVLNACASLTALEEGRLVHEKLIGRAWESDVFVGSSLVDMYAKCGSIEDAWTVFKKMPKRDVVVWNSMILGRVKSGQGQKALDLWRQMQGEGINPDHVTFVGVLNACAGVAALDEGRCVHEQIIRRAWESDVFVANSLIDMYSKCGSIDDAQTVFRKMKTRTVVSWNSMLGGYAMHGHVQAALRHFQRMFEEGVEMSAITFLSLLSACSHDGRVDEGLHYLVSMGSSYKLSPTVDHYACVVDLLGRAGHLHEAENFIKTMSCEPNATVWRSLLGACRLHGNVELGHRIANRVLELDPEHTAGYILLSNIFAAAGNWDSSANIHKEMCKQV